MQQFHSRLTLNKGDDMAKIKCDIEETYIENENGYDVLSVIATCSKCGHTTESFGTSESSINRCLALMNEECPECENNFYVED